MKNAFRNFRLLSFFIILLSVTNCQVDGEAEINSTVPVINQLQTNLKLDKFINKNISKNVKINWQNIIKIKKDNLEIYEINAVEKNKTILESNLFQKSLKYELVAIKKGNEIKSYLIEIYSSLKKDLYPSSIQKLKNFTGTLKVFELSGKEIGQLVVINGNAKNPSNIISLDQLVNGINSFYETKNLTEKLPSCVDTSVVVYTQMWESRYQIVTNAFTGAFISQSYLGEKYLGTNISYMSVPYSCDQAGDSYHILQRTSSYINVKGFSNQSEFQTSINQTNPDAYNLEFVINQNTVTAKASILLLPWAGVKIFIDQNVGSRYTIQNITSDTFGLTIGFSWTQNTYSQTTNGNVTTINIFGTLKYDTFVQSIGQVYSNPITFQIKINNTNGHIISGKRLP